MQYHIQTTPIWDAFKADNECPLCEIYSKVNARLVGQYLGEAVMEPDFRVRVNKLGFCDKHFKSLYDGENKLGLALQVNTRTQAIIDKLKTVDNVKAAKKLAEEIDKLNGGCVICETAEEMMDRYAYTIAEMFLHEKDFPSLLINSKGFCLKHYSLLLKFASHAKSLTADYLKTVSSVQIQQMRRLNNEVDRFTQKFDHNKKMLSWGTAKDSLPRAINKLRGDLIENKADKN